MKYFGKNVGKQHKLWKNFRTLSKNFFRILENFGEIYWKFQKYVEKF